MLGTCVRARVVKTIGETSNTGYVYPLNYAKIYNTEKDEYAFILGVDHPVKNFDGMIIAKLVSKTDKRRHYWIMAPKSHKFIINIDIIEALDLEHNFKSYDLICYYEHSAGAITYTTIEGVPYFLLIKNKGSNNWGFPKGHMEKGETKADTARREVFEETGIRVHLHIGFEGSSVYTVNRNTKKLVSLFLGYCKSTDVVLQKTEISDYKWFAYKQAVRALTFGNDKKILSDAKKYLIDHELFEAKGKNSLHRIKKEQSPRRRIINGFDFTGFFDDDDEGALQT